MILTLLLQEPPPVSGPSPEPPGSSFVLILPVLAIYVYVSLCIYRLAKDVGDPQAWMAWVPVFQLVTLCIAAGKPAWWFILILVPGEEH